MPGQYPTEAPLISGAFTN
ncbi:hypothetical protein YPPY19_4698, partial [Yersinia pestis PY-19]